MPIQLPCRWLIVKQVNAYVPDTIANITELSVAISDCETKFSAQQQ